MIQVLIIADDFTGALDTGVQFTKKGIKTSVITDTAYDFTTPTPADVLVINSETRHLLPEEAYTIIKTITKRAVKAGIKLLFKKTDSALRGNIAPELAAMLDAAEEKNAYFFPAYPAMGRTTKDSVHYIEGIPVADSVFGQDPFDPVETSYIPDLFKDYPQTSLIPIAAGSPLPSSSTGNSCVYLFDAQSEEDIHTGLKQCQKASMKILAGCAGLATVLPNFLNLEKTGSEKPRQTESILAICGSLNPITVKQLNKAEQKGFHRIHLTKEQKFIPDYLDTGAGKQFLQTIRNFCLEKKPLIIDTLNPNGLDAAQQDAKSFGLSFEKAREQIATRLGEIVLKWISFDINYTLFMTGGDTLVGFMNLAKGANLTPICELSPGVVLSKLAVEGKTLQVISKSGGFGNEDILLDIQQQLSINKSLKEENR